MKNQVWFEVSKDGLRQLQAGKPKTYIVRELIQNAWDEPIKTCKVNLAFDGKIADITIEDDSKIGFRDIKHAWTLFEKTYKRADPTKRGRFNLGEKQAFCMCDFAQVETTTGTVIFDKNGRQISKSSRKQGTKVTIKIKMGKKEYNKLFEDINQYIVPKKINFFVNDVQISYRKPHKIVNASLMTELEANGILKRTSRKTAVNVYEKPESRKGILYELGIPVTKIECKYDLDIQQKIPLGIDRETVLPSFLRDLFGEILNQLHSEIDENEVSEQWVNEGLAYKNIKKDAVETVKNVRFGDKVLVANPFDPNSIDEAISNGYRVIRGAELGKKVWAAFKNLSPIKSTSEKFGCDYTNAEVVTNLTENQQKVGAYAQKIAKKLLKINLAVQFIKAKQSCVVAQYGNETLTFNLGKLDKQFFDAPVSSKTTDLILHELGHYNGNHTEKGYHELITKMGGELVILALENPEFFEI